MQMTLMGWQVIRFNNLSTHEGHLHWEFIIIIIIIFTKFKEWNLWEDHFSSVFQLVKQVVKDPGALQQDCRDQGDCSIYKPRLQELWQEMYPELEW